MVKVIDFCKSIYLRFSLLLDNTIQVKKHQQQEEERVSILSHDHVLTNCCVCFVFGSWQAAEEDEIIFFPTTRMVKRLPVTVKRL